MVTKAKKPKDKEKLFEGSSKAIYYDNENNEIIQFFKDDLRVDPSKLISISGKGVLNNSISAAIMSHLNMIGINNHFIEKINMREQTIELVDVIPLKVVISNIASGRYVSSLGFETGYIFHKPMFDWYLKSSDKPNTLLNESQIVNLQIASVDEINSIKALSSRINDFLCGLFTGIGFRLIECSLEFGRTYDIGENSVMLIDEITPDTCKLIDMNTNKRYDYESIIDNPKNAITIYQEIAKRLNIA
ncbi:MAG: phosphoribosylaminoimidazole-succinocarboxamide synthase [Rickettsiaceae bacterium]|jgi:phosphoribosylaminoimidazole-succinocarboxamide synthase|nr:phosphoribosylaminoimidazole-succinocarboxamide synthase [Rickettsiaceae bacterium]